MRNPLAVLYRYFVKRYPLFQGCGPCPDRPAALCERRAACPPPAFPVDLVYTWVDGGDEALAAKRAAYLPPDEERSPLSQGSALFSDNEELRFSLRSAERYAPWARRVFILSDGQTPAWLNTDHPKIRIISHEECIPPEYLPTFNSHVIEAYLHLIPDLSEHYVYLNDDFFFASACLPQDFFTPNGLPYIFPDWRRSRRLGYARADTPHACSYANTLAFMEQAGLPGAQGLIIAHVPYAQTKSNAQQAFAFFEKPIRAFSAKKFRDNSQMAFYSHVLPCWSYCHKKAVPLDLPFYYINTARYDRHAYYEAMLREQDSGVLPLFFCLNDVGEPWEGDLRHSDMRGFLQAFYPAPSAFERSLSAPEFIQPQDGEQ